MAFDSKQPLPPAAVEASITKATTQTTHARARITIKSDSQERHFINFLECFCDPFSPARHRSRPLMDLIRAFFLDYFLISMWSPLKTTNRIAFVGAFVALFKFKTLRWCRPMPQCELYGMSSTDTDIVDAQSWMIQYKSDSFVAEADSFQAIISNISIRVRHSHTHTQKSDDQFVRSQSWNVATTQNEWINNPRLIESEEKEREKARKRELRSLPR